MYAVLTFHSQQSVERNSYLDLIIHREAEIAVKSERHILQMRPFACIHHLNTNTDVNT